jgi:Rieske Fe-S protein
MIRRREFLVVLAGATAGGCGGAGGSVTGPLRPPVAEPHSLTLPLPAVGETVALFDGSLELAMTRVTETQVVVVSRTCTHMGCTILLPTSPGDTFHCPCHGSQFTTAGKVAHGPASQPLFSYPARIDGTQVVVSIS